mmetsp:Transcript_156414/g.291945  ORF Transcript_156414/g.291945 Transcript_156414/m.291945 type:complete len:1326 (+) Transcript_156414:95-4072(+)
MNNDFYLPHSPDDSDSPQVGDPRTDGQVHPVRPTAPVPSPRGDILFAAAPGPPDGDHNPLMEPLAPPDGLPEARVQPQRGGRAGYSDGGLGVGRRQVGYGDYGSHAWRDEVPAHITDECTKENLPPLAEHEIEYIVRDATSYSAGQSTRSPSKVVGNFRFRILIFPSGTHSTGGHQVSAFVEADPIEGLDPRWVFHGVKYQISIVNWLDYRQSVTKVDTWTFSKDGIDRGWHDMVRTSELSLKTGWLGPDNSLYLRASCYVRQADSINVNSDYNFRKETGYIGLKNHGATCYMNGLLQSLFHVGEFRRIVYSIDCDDTPDSPGKGDLETSPSKSMDGDADGTAPPLIQSLQNVFYKLQTSDQAVNCRELMKSFGWDTMDAFTQHDAQELNRILCDRLEEQMKGSPMDGSIKKLFEGEMENYIECIDVDYKSKRNETFYDIQLNIKGERGQELQNIEESMRDFTAEETLEGDNAYEAEGHGKQRAKKGIRFLTFPPVLNLQLKRFHFDLEKMDMVKLNSRFEFDRRLDLSPFAPGAGSYVLHAVVVHSGDVNSGHYYVHIRPNLEAGWFKFDDDTVTPCSEYAAVEDNYGGSDLTVWNYFDKTPRELYNAQPPVRPRIHNAYMLVYIREDCAAEVLRSPDPLSTNAKMVQRCDRDVLLAEQRRKEKMEQQMKIRIRLVFERDLCKMTGFWDHAEIQHEQSLKMGRDQLVKELTTEVETLTGIPRAHLVLFSLHYRNNPRQVRFAFMSLNSTFRSHIPQFNAPHFDTSDPYLMVLCVAARGYDVHSLKWAPKTKSDKPDELQRWNDESVILLVVKYFCPQNRKIVTLGCNYMSHQEVLLNMVEGPNSWVQERLAPYVASKEVAPLQEDIDSHGWECWEEFSERDVQPRHTRRTVKVEQLWSGDVIIWQPAAPREDRADDTAGPETEVPPCPGGGEGDSDVAPIYKVDNVMELAAHYMNSMDVVVAFHDHRQPLCVDGIVSNGQWGPPRPQSAATKDANKDASPTKEERPEDAALSFSLAKFRTSEEREIKMDLRWNLNHVTSTIARTFGLTPQSGENLRLFHAPPSSSYQEPLNSNMNRTEHSLKDLARGSTMCVPSATKKPLCLHAVELPYQVARQVSDRNLCPLCIRFYDDAVREVGSCIIAVPNSGTAADVLAEAEKHLEAEWGLNRPLRLLEVTECRLHKLYKPDTPICSFACFNKSNIYYHCLRVEPDDSGSMPEGAKLLEIFHCDRQSQQAFAQPLLLAVTPGEKAASLKAKCKAKLRVPDSEFKSWRLVRCRARKTHLKDDEAWDSDPAPDNNLCLEHVHPNPTNTLTRQSRYNKPLTIK